MIESLEFVVYCHPERFWRKVGKSTDCWHWMAGKTSDGYGGYWFKGKMVAAHRFSWALVHGFNALPEWPLILDHICRNRDCVRPDHLHIISNSENVLLGIGPSAINQRKTHCHNGHELAGDNLRTEKTGKRVCKACYREWRKRRYWARKGIAA